MRIFFWLFYNCIWIFFLPIWLAIQIWQWIRRSPQVKIVWKERLALYPQQKWGKQPVVWFHGSSLGEVLSLLPLIQECKKIWGDSQILTVSTSRGHYIAKEKKATPIIAYLPLDWFPIVSRAITQLKPDVLIVFETEIWPNLFWECYRRKIPVIVVSGRISLRSFPRYYLARTFFQTVLSQAIFLMQTQEDAIRIQKIGAPASRVFHTGDIKLDGLKTKLTSDDQKFLQQYFGTISQPAIIVGSTHPTEEEMVLDIAKKLQEQKRIVTFIIAPRHLNRVPDIVRIIHQRQIPYILRSQIGGTLPQVPNDANIIILDTYGELAKVYDLAHIVVMGGTFAPIGGHNLMEPAALAKPVVFGPNIGNCRQQAKLLLEKNAGIQVQNSAQLQECLEQLLDSPTMAVEMGKRGQNTVINNVGALQRSLEKLKEYIQS